VDGGDRDRHGGGVRVQGAVVRLEREAVGTVLVGDRRVRHGCGTGRRVARTRGRGEGSPGAGRGRADDAERQDVTVAISGARRDELPGILVRGDALGGRNGSGVAERHGGRRGFVPGGSRGVCRAVRVVVVLEQGDCPGACAERNGEGQQVVERIGGGELAGGDG